MEEAKWKFKDLGKALKESFRAILRGEFLLRLNFSKYFIHIIWTFFLFFLAIWISMMVEKTLTRLEDNKKVLDDLEIYHAQKTVEVVSLGRMTTIQNLLEERGSEVKMPTEPAKTIRKK